MNVRLVHRLDLTSWELDAMFDLLEAHFEGATRSQFEADLANKSWVVLVEAGAARIAGFSTFDSYQSFVGGRHISVVCSGDTIVDRSQPQSSALLRGWLQAVHRLHPNASREPVYWLLIVSGFRTYRFLPVFWRTFYPRRNEPTPTGMQDLLNHLAVERFGRVFDPAMGIVRLEHPQVLRGSARLIPQERLADPDVAFFARANPEHERGDELVCLTSLHPSNLTAAGLRMAQARLAPLAVTAGA